jgi:hypothetical protein
MNLKYSKIYRVTFIEYTNVMKDCVKWSGNDKRGENSEFLDVSPGGDLLVRCDDLYKFMNYGEGIRNFEFVGYLCENS